MASIAAPCFVNCSLTRGSILPSLPTLRSDGAFPKVSFPVVVGRIHEKGKERMGLSVRAMAVAKFKGTLMREKQLTEMIEKKVTEAKEACGEDETSAECKVAWDEVEEVSQAKADLRLKLQQKQDPLESFCQENPETDECRVYED